MVPCIATPNVVHLISLSVFMLSRTKFRHLKKLCTEPDILTEAAALLWHLGPSLSDWWDITNDLPKYKTADQNEHSHLILTSIPCILVLKVKVKWSGYRPGVAQRVGRGIALLFHDSDTRRGWVVSSTPRPHFTSGKDPVPILQEPGWAPGPVWTGGKSRHHRDSIPDLPACSQSLYRLS